MAYPNPYNPDQKLFVLGVKQDSLSVPDASVGVSRIR